MKRRSPCQVHRHSSETPIDRHHVWPLGMDGPDVDENIVLVCPNGHRDIHAYMRLLLKYQNGVPWKMKRRYGRKSRALAKEGLRRYRDAQIQSEK